METLEPLENVIDIESAMTRLGGNRTLFLDILGMMIAQFQDGRAELETRIQNNDGSWIGANGHQLKGIAANLSANHLTELAHALEKAGKDGRFEDAARLSAEIADHLTEIQRCLNSVSR